MASNIQWTDETWNPTTGCTKISPGCAHCYIETTPPFRMEGRKFVNGKIPLRLHPDRLDKPLHWRKPRRVFVNSLSDLFHEDVPDGFIWMVWEVMLRTPWHTYQVLTKRPERMADWVNRWCDLRGESDDPKLVRGPEATRKTHPSGRGQLFAAYLDEMLRQAGGTPKGAWPTFDWMEGPRWWPTTPAANIWLGVSAERQQEADERIPWLLKTPAAVRFVSAEPLLGPIDFSRLNNGGGEKYDALTAEVTSYGGSNKFRTSDTDPLDWIIVGGESGHGSRPCNIEWVRSIVEQCQSAGVAVFCKQLGSKPYVPASDSEPEDYPSLADKKGGTMEEWPVDLRVRQMPQPLKGA